MTRLTVAVIGYLSLISPAVSQQIFDVFTTTWDRSSLFTYSTPSPVIDFVTPGTAASADIVVNDKQVYQTVYGFGATLTDSSAKLLSQLKSKNADNYWSLLGYLFDPTDGKESAGITYLRVPIGASDFSDTVYSFDDVSGDTSLKSFNINNAPSYVFSTLTDILGLNSIIHVHLVPWSPPAWMKGSKTMKGGSLSTSNIDAYANYLLKSLQGFKNKGVNAWGISIQNEPENSDTSYPSCNMPVSTEAGVATSLRTLMNNNGFSSVKIVGYEHNWIDAGAYPEQLMASAGSDFAGVSFHCYQGAVSDQNTFHSAYSNKEIYETECTGQMGTDWWGDIKWYTNQLFIGAVTNNAAVAAMWNLALDSSGGPVLPGSDSCKTACRGVITINSDGTWVPNQEFYAIAQASRAILPKDSGGPFGKRIGVTVNGGMNWALVVGAYRTGRVSSSAWPRYSLVVLNWDDSSSTTFKPVPVKATIEFQGKQATYTFPVGVTTLWWYASS
ncbi:glycoside hydrolase family 30 protein [Heliocybe sulcata]|uniref:Glycoside hydrolase family 30 protein n=1 Tax=Heliocybe sulcata TaxID=5364 RepID=A0A5C3NK42_9AGAM|nr:glycoside hydrolase family 30 protein [Heliocybe sulcata]